ncbi:family 20 glycosylhydrolase [Algoriphagus sp. AK58]|uniref:family 20 glycosylhydrolase n=1 Tax=Algoriphagus sp. AK58 TaxID=1406877 RepID=UPI0016503210|nr:family 20 glycosylhydrolase [Algoriphagus sp. AK58]
MAQLNAQWNLLENKFTTPQLHKAEISISNLGTSSVQEGWKLYFNTIFISVNTLSQIPETQIRHLQGDFFVVEGKTPEIMPGSTFSIPYQSRGAFLKNSYAPESLILVHADGKVEEISQYQTQILSEAELAEMAKSSALPVPSSQARYEENRKLTQIPDSEIPPFLPSPKKWRYTGEPITIQNAGAAVVGAEEFSEVTKFLLLSLIKGYKPQVDRSQAPINIKLSKVEGLAEEAYALKISNRRVDILASTPKGAFYGIQSFLALMKPDFWKEASNQITLPQVEIEDEPAFGYRGFFLDVARNFQTKEQVKKILDLMAFYKLNVFHFNLANDEGWRIEIPGLPELTEFGARRGFSSDESEFLWPYYGSGAFPEKSQTGTGYYTVADFQEILAYAKERHIEVIPELGVPAHSRAAILAMEKRYRELMKAGKGQEAQQYRLADPDDQSIYLSAQNFKGNTICVCQESTYAFYEKLVIEIQKMYTGAGIELKNWHTGGDEVPRGVWTASPICKEFLTRNPDLKVEDLNDYFRNRTGQILQKYGLQMGGWEEIGQTHRGNDVIPNPKFADQNWRLYAWNAVAGWGGEDMAYRLANAGYPVVICSSANFYFDLAYDWDPDERGHTWSGVVDMYQSWKTVPRKLYLSHDKTIEGNAWDWSEAEKRFTPLTELGKRNILGVSGQLWTETVKGPEMMEYYLLPKMLGYIERAWQGDPDWSKAGSESEIKERREQEWNRFVNLVGQKELPRLESIFGGFKYRLPRPGVMIKDGRVLVNSAYPGLLIRYTDNGSEPDENSPIYREPIPYFSGYTPQFKLFTQGGSSGRSGGLD